MSTVKTNNVQVGQSGTATNNFTLYQPSVPDGTVRLGVGNSGATTSDVITVSSSTVNVAATLQQSGVGVTRLVQGTAQASTSGTSISFTGIPSWAKRVTVLFSGVSLSGTSVPLVQLGDSGGIETSGYVSGSAVARDAAASVGGNSTLGFIVYVGSAATNTFSGSVRIENVDTNVWVASVLGTTGASTGSPQGVSGGGTKTISDTLTQIRVISANGTDTFDAGSINILYEG
jgi:hypothetical protein